MEKKLNIPKKDAGRKWAARLRELRERKPPQSLIDKIIRDAERKQSATPTNAAKDLDV